MASRSCRLGIGKGFIAAPLTNIVLAKIRKIDIGSASGILMTGFQIAYATGISLIGIVWLNGLSYLANMIGVRQANVQIYSDTFRLCLYLLAAYTKFLIPLALILIKNTRSKTAQSVSDS